MWDHFAASSHCETAIQFCDRFKVTWEIVITCTKFPLQFNSERIWKLAYFCRSYDQNVSLVFRTQYFTITFYALQYMWRYDHRRKKNKNLLLFWCVFWQICDFGLSKWKEHTQTQTPSSSTPAGTISHIPPEKFMNINQHRTKKYDVYSFAILLWELITDNVAFKNGIVCSICQIVRFVIRI